MQLAYSTLEEATHSSNQCAIQLFYCVRNMFELFCTVVAMYHKESLATLPQLAGSASVFLKYAMRYKK